jgi:hypothetical protein
MQHFLSRNGINLTPITYITFYSMSDGGVVQISGKRPELGIYHINTLNIDIDIHSQKSGDCLFNFTLIKSS